MIRMLQDWGFVLRVDPGLIKSVNDREDIIRHFFEVALETKDKPN